MEDKDGKIIADDDIILCVVNRRQMLVHVKDASDMPNEVIESSKLKIIANAKSMPSLIK